MADARSFEGEPPSEPSAKRLKVDETMNARQIREVERQIEKERKEAERKAEKERKEAERKAEKERKEAERKAEKERKEAERKAEKERKEAERKAEKERKQAEKEAREAAEAERKMRAQPKINLFFKKDTPEPVSSQQQSDIVANTLQSSPQKKDSELSEYRKVILPFQPKIDGKLFSLVCNCEVNNHEMDPLDFLKQLKCSPTPNPKTTISNSEFTKRMVLTREASQVSDLISQLRIRRLQFSHLSQRYVEDPFHASINAEFRPPYIGTSKDLSLIARRQLAVDPFRTDLDPQLSYEYDSEAEWDPEEGEDLNEEDDESDEEIDEDQDELSGFYTSDEDESSKRPKIVGPLVPVVIWGDSPDLREFEIVCKAPIDPFKEAVTNEPAAPQATTDPEDLAAVLQSYSSKLDVEEFKRSLLTHVNSTSTKILIIELLKEKFPNAHKEVRQLFDLCMERAGKKRNEKKWVLTERARFFNQVNDHTQ